MRISHFVNFFPPRLSYNTVHLLIAMYLLLDQQEKLTKNHLYICPDVISNLPKRAKPPKKWPLSISRMIFWNLNILKCREFVSYSAAELTCSFSKTNASFHMFQKMQTHHILIKHFFEGRPVVEHIPKRFNQIQ